MESTDTQTSSPKYLAPNHNNNKNSKNETQIQINSQLLIRENYIQKLNQIKASSQMVGQDGLLVNGRILISLNKMEHDK